MKKKILLSSILTIALCLSVIAGSTYALFTGGTSVNIVVKSAEIKVSASVINDESSSNDEDKLQAGTVFTDYVATATNNKVFFENGGYAEMSGGHLSIVNMTPGDYITFSIVAKNDSDIAVMYRVLWSSSATGTNLADALNITVTVDNEELTTAGDASAYYPLGSGDGAAFTVRVEFPNGDPANDDLYQKAQTTLYFTVEAVQGNGVDDNGDLIQ